MVERTDSLVSSQLPSVFVSASIVVAILGMIVGFAADGRADRVIGINASAKPEQSREQITRIARHTTEQVDLGRDITAQDVVLDTRYGGPEYALPNEGTLEAIRLCARLEGVMTEQFAPGSSACS
ncbi:1-aminocyclopropane-1-carboxylate deaminase [Paraburkholderia sabiae]|nr:1-aminocyclopropane-1-carboxylate deaminase [Paraburkholderia sabiae]